MTTIRTTNGIPLLKLKLSVAVAAQVGYERVVDVKGWLALLEKGGLATA
jgi:hypothetical protein